MKRYSPFWTGDGSRMTPDDKGKWVSLFDVKVVMRERKEAKEKHEEALDMCERYIRHLHKAIEERDAARTVLEGICSEFEAAITHAEWRASGSKGMSVPFQGDFAAVVQLPSTINRMKWWVQKFRAALTGEKP